MPTGTEQSRTTRVLLWSTSLLATALVVVLVLGFLHNSQQDSRIKLQSATIVDDQAKMKSQVTMISTLRSQQDLQSTALQAAKTYGVWVSSYNYQDLTSSASNWALIESHSDASFRASFEQTKASLTSLVTSYDASATARVVNVGVESIDSTQAVVVLLIDQTVTNNTQKSGPVTSPLRAVMTMTRQDGQWLIDDLQVPA